MRSLRFVSVSALVLAAGACARAQPAMPEGNAGISAKYVGDRGIESDPNVVFFEDFNKPSLDAIYKRWKAVCKRRLKSAAGDGRKVRYSGHNVTRWMAGVKTPFQLRLVLFLIRFRLSARR